MESLSLDSRGGHSLTTIAKILDSVGKGFKPSDLDVRNAIKSYAEVLWNIFEESIADEVRRVFGSDLGDLIRVYKERARVIISTSKGSIEVNLERGRVRVTVSR
jgi:hypothetical protein